jgi:hypothetical protein
VNQSTKTFVAGGLLALALFGPAMAGPLEDGEAALNRSDYAAAVKIFRPLADAGNASAQGKLGKLYADGQGAPQDYAQAVGWYRKAAEQGDYVGQISLGTMYEFGHGAPQDYVRAHMWYNLAAAGKFEIDERVPQDSIFRTLAASAFADARHEAATLRDRLAARMTPAQIAEAQRMASEWVESHPSRR